MALNERVQFWVAHSRSRTASLSVSCLHVFALPATHTTYIVLHCYAHVFALPATHTTYIVLHCYAHVFALPATHTTYILLHCYAHVWKQLKETNWTCNSFCVLFCYFWRKKLPWKVLFYDNRHSKKCTISLLRYFFLQNLKICSAPVFTI